MKATRGILLLIVIYIGGCQRFQQGDQYADLTIDGSSTVYSIADFAVQAYRENEPSVDISLNYSGTSNGIHKLCSGTVDIANASRKITSQESQLCRENGISFREMLVAKDGIAVVVHANNLWVDYLTVAELQRIWSARSEGVVTSWKDIRTEWPDRRIKLFGPGTASGTYDYFAESILGEHATRGDYVASENDEILVEGVSENPNGLGFFGLGYYRGSNTSLKLVPIDDQNSTNGEGPTIPSIEAIRHNRYQPLTRNMYVYIAEQSLQKETARKFADFFLQQAPQFVNKAGYIPQTNDVYRESRDRLLSVNLN